MKSIKKTAKPELFAIISVIYNEMLFESIPLELNDPLNSELVHKLSEEGTSDMKMLKFPTEETKFVIISKEQLSNSIVEIEIVEIIPEPEVEPELEVKPKRSRKKTEEK